jgi:hemoglobin
MCPTLYDFAGGEDALLALATAHHARCLADLDPEHVQRLAAYWAGVLGGPPRYSELSADHSFQLRLHAGNGVMGDLDRRFVECFVAAVDDVFTYSAEEAVVPGESPMPRWSRDGLQKPFQR